MIIFSKTIFVSLFIGFLNIASLFAQNTQDTIVYVNLTSINPNVDDSDLQQLDNYFENVKVIAMGESTHGTSEFSVMRHRMFKYLVKHHEFNTFFLEADYANCLRTNAYIHGKKDNVTDVVNEIALWPWTTEEMIDLVNWMRAYNAKNLNNQLNFIGVDMQQYVETVNKIDDILQKNKLPITDSVIFQSILDANFFLITKKEELEIYKTIWEEKKSIDISQLNEEDERIYSLLLRHLTQILGEKYGWEKHQDYRDYRMSENILHHLNQDTMVKGFFWAHNLHICNMIPKKKKFGTAGGHLKRRLDKQYFSIGLDFDEGSFNAYYPDTNSTNIMEGKAYTLGAVTVGKSPTGSVASTFRHINTPIFIEYQSLLNKNKYIKMNDIGAAYDPTKATKPKAIAHNQMFGGNGFDALVLIKKSTPTHLLKNKKIETEK
jgi:erythromycin esterase